MSNDLPYLDEEIQRLLCRIKAEQEPTPAPDEPPAETKPEEVTARPIGIMRELSIDEILKKMESEISESKPAPVNAR
jgi:hypothetical protein